MAESIVKGFAEDTLIRTGETTQKKIRHIVPGDTILCPHKDGTETMETVTDVTTPQYAEVYVVVAKDTTGKVHHCYTTTTQCLLGDDGKYVRVADIGISKKLHGDWQVVSVIHSGDRKVYDLNVSGDNTYYADGFIAKGND